MSLRWYVLRSKPNKEMALWKELTGRGFECFYPYLQVHPVNPRSRKIRPYFPGYLFLRVDMKDVKPSSIEWMPFSNGFVSFDGTPSMISDSLIQALRRHVDQIHASGSEQAMGLTRGEVVSIQGGPFHGYEAMFDAYLPGTERVQVLLKLLQEGRLKVEVPVVQIQRKKRC